MFFAWYPASRMLVLLLKHNAQGQPAEAQAISMEAVNALDPNATAEGLAASLPRFVHPDERRVELAKPSAAPAPPPALLSQRSQRDAQLLREAQREQRRGRHH